MNGFKEITPEVAEDLIELINNLKNLPKTSKVEYSVQNKNGEWVKKSFNYVPLDDILEKIKKNNNFCLLQPIGTDELGVTGVKNILIHKSGHVFESLTYPINQKEKVQDEGAEITYKKRYSIGAFLGISTEEDTDGGDSEATQSEERKVTQKQIEILEKYYQGEYLEKLLKVNKIKKLEDMSMKKASEIISEILKKGKKENE